MKITGNEPINPFFKWNEAGYGDCVTIYDAHGGKQHIPYTEGLTIRQYYAGLAMQGIVASPCPLMREDKTLKSADCKILAEFSCSMADALIEELNKTEKE